MAQDRAFGALDDAWGEALGEATTLDIRALLQTAAVLAGSGEGNRAAGLLSLLAVALREAGRGADALTTMQSAIPYASRAESYADETIACLKAAHGERPGFDLYMEMSKIEGTNSLPDAMRRLEKLLAFPKGGFVRHRGWGVGVVVSVEARNGAIEIDFEKKKGHVFPIDGAVQYLASIPADGLDARSFSDLEALQQLMIDDPAEVVRLAVRHRGGAATSAQIKKDLTQKVVSTSAWSKLWTKAKRSLIHDPLIEITGGSRPTISMRMAAVRFADEVEKAVTRAKRFETAYKEGRRLLKEIGQKAKTDVTVEERERVAAVLIKKLNSDIDGLLERAPGYVVAGLYLVEDLAAGDAPTDLDGRCVVLATEAEAFGSVASTMPDSPTLRRYVKRFCLEHGDEVCEQFESLMPSVARDVFQLLVKELAVRNPEGLGVAFTAIVQSSDPEVDPLLETARQVFQGKTEEIPGAPSHSHVFERVLAFADRIERLRAGGDPSAPNIRIRVRSLLGAGKHACVKRYFKLSPLTAARHTYARIMASPAIDDEVREASRSVVARHHPKLLAKDHKHYWEEEDTLFTTKKGLASLRSDFEDLMNNKIPTNARAIGVAREHGDLSENAEYTAALEERDQLVGRADRLKRDLEKARLLDDLTLDKDVVGPGTIVELEDQETMKSEGYTILGPWDVDLDARIISYTAPLAQGLLGRRAGDEAEITLPGGAHRRFKVISVALVSK